MVPVLGMPAFQPGLTDLGFDAIQRRGKNRFIHFSIDNRLMTRSEIESEVAPELDFLFGDATSGLYPIKIKYISGNMGFIGF